MPAPRSARDAELLPAGALVATWRPERGTIAAAPRRAKLVPGPEPR
ncbi:hypothetical protein ACF09H_41480 [Streptomyces sp. NPDC014983]